MEWARSKTIGRHTEVTLFTPIRPGLIPGERRTYEQRLAGALDSVQQRVMDRVPTPISVMPTIHFARWLILRPAQYLQNAEIDPASQPSLRSWLFFESNFDGELKDYLREFSVFLGEDVNRIWGNCEGWPEGGSKDFEPYWDYAKRHQITTHAFYAAYPEISVGRIRQLDRFKHAFDRFVAATRQADGSSVPEVGRLLDEFLVEHSVYPSDFPAEGGTYVIDNKG
ncbi:MAG: hypothetical protein U1E23_11910 [Reyranellaceae bacterium]